MFLTVDFIDAPASASASESAQGALRFTFIVFSPLLLYRGGCFDEKDEMLQENSCLFSRNCRGVDGGGNERWRVPGARSVRERARPPAVCLRPVLTIY